MGLDIDNVRRLSPLRMLSSKRSRPPRASQGKKSLSRLPPRATLATNASPTISSPNPECRSPTRRPDSRRSTASSAGDRTDFDDPAIGTVAVAAVMADPESFAGETLADPLEGLGLGRCKAKVVRGETGGVIIHSFAHGGGVYRLTHDEASLTAFVSRLSADKFLAGFSDAMQDFVGDEGARERVRQMAIGTGPEARRAQSTGRSRERPRREPGQGPPPKRQPQALTRPAR